MTTPASVPLTDLVGWLDTTLNTRAIPDISNNGLQIEGRSDVRRIAVAVDATLNTIQDAADAGADLLITHHGLFWGQPMMLTGPHKRRVQAALDAGLSLYTSHIPLDLHPELGNNAMIASALSLQNRSGFGDYKGLKIGVQGTLPFPMSLQDLADRIQKLTGEICLVHGGGPGEVHRVGIISGSASDHIPQAAREGLDTFITGEPKHQAFSDPFEYGVNAIYAGHYDTEVFGVRALAARIEETFGLPWQFLHHPSGL
ncbi:Nif3-like dinuclear metal center hexameric protein [Deinococcus maricopensis]|uniref:GTP cyclohydrolase 1 type 2 homolog n=1 Tax=Deinococcus maricopensis (strain DSM 21211 / LMG 22137 / NRRL B-23946 / LB-34) TaxID=709986 RepID=E8UAD5_DEIML|nr:Nif3-like dinuclear metal center hexameric protein [Deinococcus maricopensis]ADV68024.1 NGG1p interacting factor 3 protein, NIF3 [Deinococcus maricopensis DSM 21211]